MILRQNEPRPTGGPSTSLAPTTSLEVLLAEDCALNALVATTLLRQLGHRVTRVGDGLEALKAFDLASFDAILLDLQLPGIDGYAVAAAIRAKSAGGKQVPIIAVTALSDPTRVAALEKAGFDGYVEKPMRLPVLQLLLERALTPRAALDSGPAASLDRDSLLLEVGGDTALLMRMMRMFREQTIQQVHDLESGIERNDAKRVGTAAHALKGSIANFSRGGAYHSAARLEELGSSKTLAPAESEYAVLMRELSVLEREMTQLEASLEDA